MTTTISVSPPNSALQRLEQLSPLYTRVALNVADQPLSVGNQYLLVGLPLGAIQLDQPRQLLAQFIRERFALAGIRAEIVESGDTADFTVGIANLSLSAFDLVLTRRLVAEVDLKFDVPGVSSVIVRDGASELRQFGFEAQLKPLLVEALRAVCDRLVALAPLHHYSANK